MPNQINPPYIRLALALLLTSSLVGCGQGGSGSAAKGGFMGGPIEVGYQIVRAQDVALETELTGRVNAYETSEVRPQVDGVIRDRLYTEGARVQAGQALYQIDAAPYQAAYDSARAALGAAEATAQRAHQRADRFRRIVESGAVSRDANEDVQTADNQAQAAVDVARAQLETAKINLDYTKVRAPISGRIGRSLVTPGALVTARQTNPIATIQNFQQVYVDLTQSSAQLLALRQAQSSGQLTRDKTTLPVTLLLEDGSTYAHPGKLEFTDVTVDTGTGAVTVRALFPNPDGVLLPGIYVRAHLSTGTANQALLVPQTAVGRSASGSAQLTLVNTTGQLEIRSVLLGAAHGADWIVAQGLKPGEHVVVEGLAKIRPGLPLKPVLIGGPVADTNALSQH